MKKVIPADVTLPDDVNRCHIMIPVEAIALCERLKLSLNVVVDDLITDLKR